MNKTILILFSTVFFFFASAQDKLCEEYAYMYSKCFTLDSNGSFTYEYSHCTGTEFGSGKYKRDNRSLIFDFDKVEYSTVQCTFNDSLKGRMKIENFIFDSDQTTAQVNLDYDDKFYVSNWEGVYESDYYRDSIILHRYPTDQPIIIIPEIDHCNAYKIYWRYPWDTVVEKGTIIELKKKGRKYKLKEEILLYNPKTDEFYPKMKTTKYILKK